MYQSKSIQLLQELPPYEISLLIKNNHPQIIAQICYLMDSHIASEVLSYLTVRLRNDVVLRISTLYDTHTYWLDKLDVVLLETINSRSSSLIIQDGVDKVKSILANMSQSIQTSVITNIHEYDPEHADKIQSAIGPFTDERTSL